MNMNELKILVVLPLYGGSLPIGQYCARALLNLGCSVRSFEAQKLYSAYQGVKELDLAPSRIDTLANSFLRLVSQAVVSMAEEQKPDFLLALAQAPLDRTSLLKLRKMGVPTVMWFVEDYKIFNYWTTYAPLYDAFAVIQKEPFLSELKKLGQSRAFYLPLAALPEFHKPTELSERDKAFYGSDISFLGAGYPNRRMAFRRLADRNFKIWGSDWDGENILKDNIQLNGKRVGVDEGVKIYNASRINLNLHSSVHTDSLVSHGDFVNPRTFELAAMGAFQLVDKRSLLGELFKDDELAVFDSAEEMYQKIDYFLDNPQERELYAAKARKRVSEDHTYELRMRTLISYMEKNFGPFARREKDAAGLGLDLPEEIKKEMGEITKKLKLPLDASFEDIIGRLKQQSGRLTEAETALLFLDEWAKQFKK